MEWLIIDKELQKAKSYALRLLTYRQRSEQEIKSRLMQKGYDPIIAEQIIDFLREYKLIDDQEFVRQYIYSKITSPKPVGPNRIKYELIQLGIDKGIIEEALNDIDYQIELDLAKKLIEKTIHKSTAPPKIHKLVALLQRRGFSYTIIKEALANYDLDVT
jgi:regulatory protein